MEALPNMSTRIRFRRDTAANWTSTNPILTTGELGYESDTGKFKIGNNSDAWTILPYSIRAELGEGNLNDLKDVTITSAANGDFLRWNGSAWINDAVNLGTDTTGSFVESLTAGTGVTLTNNTGENATPTISIGQSVATSASPTFANVTISSVPSSDNHAATKAYVDFLAAGIVWHDAAKFATAAVLPGTPTYSNGTSGVGATLTATSNARLLIDGTNATVNDRVLVKDQADAKQNGVYKVTTQGSVSAPYVLTRAIDFDASTSYEKIGASGDAVYVTSGSYNANQGFITLSTGTGTDGTYVIGTDDITFGQFTGTATFTAGNGVTITGNTINVESANSGRIVVNADSIDLASGIASIGTYKSVTVDTYGRVTAGTNPTTLSGYGITDAAPIASPTFTGTVSGITKTMVGLGSVDNTADTAKPVSTAQQTALDLKANIASPTFTGTVTIPSGASISGFAPLASPTFTGTPTLPTGTIATTQTAANSTTAVATTAFVTTADNLKANLAGPTFTGTPTAPTASAFTNTTQIATTAYVVGTLAQYSPVIDSLSDIGNTTIDLVPTNGDLLKWNGTVWVNAAGYALLASPTFTGTPTLPTGTIATTQTAANSTTAVATTAFVTTADALKANIASPTFTGTVSGVTATMVGLGSVDNTADTAKPVSTAQQTALDLKANLASPTFTGTPTLPTGTIATTQTASDSTTKVATTAFVTTADNLKANIASPTFTGVPAAPTAAQATNTTQVATTAFVRAEVAALVGSAGATLDTLGEIATALGNDANLSTTLTTSIGLKAPLASPTFTGTVTIPSGASISGFAPLASPTFTGTPLSTTAAADTNTTQIATTAYVVGQAYAKLASPTFTGTVTLPAGTVTSTMILDGTIANADISTTAAIDLGKLADISTSAQTASYTLVLADKNKLVEMSNASANTLTVPPNSSVAFPVGSQIRVLQTNAGQCTLTAGSGVTINGTPGLKLRTQWASATLIKRATDTWVAVGDLSA